MIFIVVLNWCGAEDTIECLRSLFGLQGEHFSIVICDNGSPDGSYTVIKQWLSNHRDEYEYLRAHPLVELSRDEANSYQDDETGGIYLVQIGVNLGYSGGNNVGIRFALSHKDADYVWLLNNDTEVESDSLTHLLKRFRTRPDLGMCGSKLVYHHDRRKVQGLGGLFNPWLATSFHYAINQDSHALYVDDEIELVIDYVIGASLLVRADLFRDIGLLQEGYFLYFEEIDLAFRARPKYAIGVASSSVVYHKEGATTERGTSVLSDFYVLRNRLLFTWWNAPRFIFTVWLGLFVALFNRIRRKQWRKAWNVWRIIIGCRDFPAERSAGR